MTDAAIQHMIDKRELDELIYDQMTFTDLCDWERYRRCLADVIDFDLSDHVDRVAPPGFGLVNDPDEWIARVKSSAPGFDATIHSVLNLVHDLDGDHATSRCFVVGEHQLVNDLGDPNLTVATHSTYGSIRTPEGWKIKSLKLKLMYYRGNPSLYAIAAKRVAERAND